MRFVIYGLTGQTKTTLAYSFHWDVRTGPALAVDMNGNPDLQLMKPGAPPVVSPDKSDELDTVIDFFNQGQPVKHALREYIPNWNPDILFKSLIVDTLTDWQNGAIARITGNENVRKTSAVIPPMATSHGAQIFAQTMKVGRDMFNQRGYNVILVIQEQESINFETGQRTSRPFLYGQARQQLLTWANLVGRVEKVNVSGKPTPYVYFEEASVKSLVKNQIAWPTLGKSIANPDAPKILDLIEQHYREVDSVLK